MAEQDPNSGKKWADRFGVYKNKGKTHTGNVEPYLTYKKLYRTGRLLRGLKTRRGTTGSGSYVCLYNKVSYAEAHELGGIDGQSKTIRKPNVSSGTVSFGGRVVARPFMRPSQRVLRAPYQLFKSKVIALGWK